MPALSGTIHLYQHRFLDLLSFLFASKPLDDCKAEIQRRTRTPAGEDISIHDHGLLFVNNIADLILIRRIRSSMFPLEHTCSGEDDGSGADSADQLAFSRKALDQLFHS